MKKLIKFFAVLTSLAICVEAVNTAVFKCAAQRRRPARLKRRVYNWRFGRIRYVSCGNENAKPLLLIHGIAPGAGLHEWDDAIHALSSQYHVYALDLLGYGESEKSALSTSAYLYSLLIRDFVKEVIQDKTFVVANNLSCFFTAIAAQLAPTFISKIICVAPYAVRQNPPTLKKKWIKRILELPIIGTAIYLYAHSYCMFNNLFYKQNKAVSETQKSAFYDAAHYGGANARFSFATRVSNYLYMDTERTLRNTKQPILLLWEDSEDLFPQANRTKELYRTCRKFFN